MQKLRQLVLAYERDPKHVITQAHIAERQRCVIVYGSDAVQQVLREVYQQLLEERQCQSSATSASAMSVPSVHEKKQSISGRARNAKHKKTSTTHRRGFRLSTHRR